MKHKVIVIGAGFAGIHFVRNLNEDLFDILLIDKLNHHQFQPLFYQVATSQIEPSSISFPIRHIFKSKKNVQIRLTEVLQIDSTNNKIQTTIGEFDYDYLIIATGCKTNFFGNDEIKEHAFPLKSTYDAITIRNHIIQTFENIISAKDDEKEALCNLIIVGAGPTGVELAGAFAEIKKYILPKDYPKIDFSKFNINLIEGSKNTLNNMSDRSKIASRKYLTDLGVNIFTQTTVKAYNGDTVMLSNGNSIKSKTVIWAAGVTGNIIDGINKDYITPTNRIIVDKHNKVICYDNIYAVGDISCIISEQFPKGHPQVANVAINQAKNLAKNLENRIIDKTITEFEYKDLGTMATIGRNKAVVDFRFIYFTGYFAWMIWMFLHLMLILSVRNKLIIFINWAWAYISKDSSLRLILTIDKNKK